jgi:uncharacterized protein YjbI with pentapeptide repeats
MSSRKYSENHESLNPSKNEKHYTSGFNYRDIMGIAYRSGVLGLSDSLEGFDFRDLDFEPRGMKMPDQNLKGCIFEGLTLSDGYSIANFRYSILIDAHFEQSILKKADLTGADLTGADLTGADLTGADLTGADLKDVIFGDTILRGATLTNVKNLNMQNLEDLAIIDDTTTLPTTLPSKPSKKTFGSRVRKFFGMKSTRSNKGGKSRKYRKSRKSRKY